MNDEFNKLREIVERATAAGKRVPDDLDADTVALRRGWLKLGQLIEQDIQSDETRDDAQLGIEMAEFGRVIGTPADSNLARTRRFRAWSYVLRAAASLLIGVGLAFAFRFFSAERPQNGPMPIVKNSDPANQPIVPIVHPPDDGDELVVLNDDSVKRITSLSRATMVVVVPFSLF